MWDAGLLENDPILAWYRADCNLLKPGDLRLAVDFDFTLTAQHSKYNLQTLPQPRTGAVETIRQLYRQGWIIIIATSRFDSTVFVAEQIETSFEIVSEFLRNNNIPFDSIWKEQHCAKPLATWHLDDRSLPPFPGWEESGRFLQTYMFLIENVWQSKHPFSYAEAVRQFRIQNGGCNMVPDDNVFGELIYAYGRKDAIADGVLVDLTGFKVCQEHFKYPIACSQRVWKLIEEAAADPDCGNDIEGLLHDILWMSRTAGQAIGVSERIFTVLIQRRATQESFDMRIMCGPGDDLEPVLTIMLIDED